MVGGVSQGLPSKLYLTCEVASRPHTSKQEVYRTVPKTSDQFYRDTLEAGNLSLFTSPPDTWVIDLSAATLSPSADSPFTFNVLEQSDTALTASRSYKDYLFLVQINRISGSLNYTVFMPPAARETWLKKHGKPFPENWTWLEQCDAASAPKI
jgi:hypothetical protein